MNVEYTGRLHYTHGINMKKFASVMVRCGGETQREPH